MAWTNLAVGVLEEFAAFAIPEYATSHQDSRRRRIPALSRLDNVFPITDRVDDVLRRQRERKAAGVCIKCWKPATGGTVRCDKHREELRLQDGIRRARRRAMRTELEASGK